MHHPSSPAYCNCQHSCCDAVAWIDSYASSPDPSPTASSGCPRTARTDRTAKHISCPPRSRTGNPDEQLSAGTRSRIGDRPWGGECCLCGCRGTSWPWRCHRTRCRPRTPRRRSRRHHRTASSSLSWRKHIPLNHRQASIAVTSSPTCLIHPLGQSGFYDSTLLICVAVYIGLLLVCYRKED